MKAEEMLRREMNRALEEMPEGVDLETRFDARRRRYRRVQGMQLVATVAVIAAIAVNIVPRIVGDNTGLAPPQTGGSPDPTSTVMPGGSVTDMTVGYQATLPDGWYSRFEQGALTAMGPRAAGSLGETGSANIPSQFYVLVTPTTLRYQDELDRLRTFYEQLETAGASTTETQTTVADRPAVSWGVVYPDDRSEQFAGDEGWCPGCRVSDYLVQWSHGYIMRIEVVARSVQANEQWYPEGLRVVSEMIEAPADPYSPASGELGDVDLDDATETVLQFMDARIAGEGAEMWLSTQAKTQYEASQRLYSPTSNPHYAGYRVLRRAQADANSYEFVIEIVSEYTGDSTSDTQQETLLVGPGTNHRGTTLMHVIRGAQYCSEAC